MPWTSPRRPTVIAADLPTPAELSSGTNFADYVEEQLAARGVAVLPTTPVGTSIAIPPQTPYRWLGGSIVGAGMPTVVYNPANGFWMAVANQHITRITAQDPDQPLFDLSSTQGIEFKNLMFDSTGVHFRCPQIVGWPNNYITFDRVAFSNHSVAFHAGEGSGGNAADVHFKECHFLNGGWSLRVEHNQGVNYTFDKNCRWLRGEGIAILGGGGFVTIDSPQIFGTKTILRIDGDGTQTGWNNGRFELRNLYIDRQSTDPPPIIVDASRFTGNARVLVDGFKVTRHSSTDTAYLDRPLFLSPLDVGSGSYEIEVRSPSLNLFAFVTQTPEAAANPFGDQGWS